MSQSKSQPPMWEKISMEVDHLMLNVKIKNNDRERLVKYLSGTHGTFKVDSNTSFFAIPFGSGDIDLPSRTKLGYMRIA